MKVKLKKSPFSIVKSTFFVELVSEFTDYIVEGMKRD